MCNVLKNFRSILMLTNRSFWQANVLTDFCSHLHELNADMQGCGKTNGEVFWIVESFKKLTICDHLLEEMLSVN